MGRRFTYCSCWLPVQPPDKRKGRQLWCRSRWLPSPGLSGAGRRPADSTQQAHCISLQTHMLGLDFQCARSGPRGYKRVLIFCNTQLAPGSRQIFVQFQILPKVAWPFNSVQNNWAVSIFQMNEWRRRNVVQGKGWQRRDTPTERHEGRRQPG